MAPVLAARELRASSVGVPVAIGLLAWLWLLLLGAQLQPWGSAPAGVAAWASIMMAIVIQAAPFLVLGVVVSGVIAAFVPAQLLQRLLPRNPVGSVAAAGLAGVALPGCECASVPVAGALMRAGVRPAAALTFLLASPAVNPVVIVATAVAFPTNPMMPVARLLASLLAAIVVGLLWWRFGRTSWLAQPAVPHAPDTSRAEVFRTTVTHDFLHAGGYLVLGGAFAATLNTVVPRGLLDLLASHPVSAVAALAVLAILVAVCSEADAFVAASLSGFSPVAQLTFMVVSPMVDVKLIAMQAGSFGTGFAARFAPVTFLVCVLAAVAVGGVLL